MVSRTSQWLRWAISVVSIASTAAASPSVLISQMPMSSSLVRIERIASSSSRASASGYQAAPWASIAAASVGSAAVGAFTVKVALRFARSISTVTFG